jgi:hypothetical protein
MAKKRSEGNQERIRTVLAEDSQLQARLSDPDDFQAVIIGQTYIEALLSQFFEHRFVYPVGYVPFGQMLSFVIAFGDLSEDYRNSLNALATLRNDFAHKLDHKLSDEPQHMSNLKKHMSTIDDYFSTDADPTPLLPAAIEAFAGLTDKLSADQLLVRASFFFMYLVLFGDYERLHGTTTSPG